MSIPTTRALVAFSLACTAMLAPTASTVPVAVNPVRTPVTVTIEVPVAQSVSIRVVRPADGQVVAILGPMSAAAGPVTIPWSGGRGPGGTGVVVADGTYRLEGLAADGTALTTTPTTVSIDSTAPHPVLSAPQPTIPAARARVLPLRPGGAEEVRAIVRRPGAGAPIITAGAWRPAGTTLALPTALRSKGIVGTVAITPEGRDAAGNTGTGDPVIWSVQPTAGKPVVVRRVRTKKRLVALTIDDGYGPLESMRMIQAARDAGATLTFCFNAVNQSMWGGSFRRAIRTAVEDGVLEVCSHGYSHRTSRSSSESFGFSDLTGNLAWDRIAGVATGPFYRPPYGDFGAGLRAAARRAGYRYVVMWDVDTNDWRGLSASAITQAVVGRSRPGSIVLMHTKPNTATAMPDIIRGLRKRGLRPVGLGELISAGRPG